MDRLNSLPETINKNQLLFGINQGGTYEDLRIEHMHNIAELDLAGYAIGGLAVGEETEEMYRIIDAVEPYMPVNKPRYLMGVGTPVNILEAVHRGVDFFDCVMPSRNARHGYIFTWDGTLNLNNEKYTTDEKPLSEVCDCPACRNHSRGYLRHLIRSGEVLGMRLCVLHNLYFYNELMEKIREAIEKDEFEEFYQKYRVILDQRI
jgi:queuine tRNA-ribosyltransferase